jgi:predicted alpha/beta-hydrolase family hydrolase
LEIEPRGRSSEGTFGHPERTIAVGEVRVSALAMRPAGARAAFLLAHGAGAGMRHPVLEAVARALFRASVATYRFQFLFTERGRKRPDPPALLEATLLAAHADARATFVDLPLYAGGKSMGGRIASNLAARGALPSVAGLIFLGYPLHAAGKPAVARGAHLASIAPPMLFLQGTRDALCRLDLLQPILGPIAHARLHVVDGADHGFAVPKRTGRSTAAVIDELASSIAAWLPVTAQTA